MLSRFYMMDIKSWNLWDSVRHGRVETCRATPLFPADRSTNLIWHRFLRRMPFLIQPSKAFVFRQGLKLGTFHLSVNNTMSYQIPPTASLTAHIHWIWDLIIYFADKVRSTFMESNEKFLWSPSTCKLRLTFRGGLQMQRGNGISVAAAIVVLWAYVFKT